MFSWMPHRRTPAQYADGGLVFCRRQERDVEVNVCLACASLKSVQQDEAGRVLSVTCTPARPVLV